MDDPKRACNIKSQNKYVSLHPNRISRSMHSVAMQTVRGITELTKSDFTSSISVGDWNWLSTSFIGSAKGIESPHKRSLEVL